MIDRSAPKTLNIDQKDPTQASKFFFFHFVIKNWIKSRNEVEGWRHVCTKEGDRERERAVRSEAWMCKGKEKKGKQQKEGLEQMFQFAFVGFAGRNSTEDV